MKVKEALASIDYGPVTTDLRLDEYMSHLQHKALLDAYHSAGKTCDALELAAHNARMTRIAAYNALSRFEIELELLQENCGIKPALPLETRREACEHEYSEYGRCTQCDQDLRDGV